MPKLNKIKEPVNYHRKIRDWPESERPREKLLRSGAESLSDAELLAILLRSGTRQVTAVDLAKHLVKEYRSLSHLASREVNELTRIYGLGKTKAVTLAAAFELGRRTLSRHEDKLQIRSPEDVVRRFAPRLKDLQFEVFYALLLDSANHLLCDVEVSRGILNSSLSHPREVFRRAIIEPAASIILLHNHPSGNPEPSSEDLQMTKQIVEAGKIIGIPVHDHIIIAGNTYTSLAERGHL